MTPIDQIEPKIFNFTQDEVETISRMKESVSSFGLFHAIIIQGDQPPYKLVTGRKRLQIFRELNLPEIPATILPEVVKNPHEIALHENLRRSNLPWYDQVELERELHELRVSQHGAMKHGRPGKSNTGWSQNDTARELGLALGTFSQDMQLATALLRNPHLRNIKDKSTALRLIKQAAAREINEVESLIPTEGMNQVFLGESYEVLKNFPDKVFDICITDPPWSVYQHGENQVENLTSDNFTLLVFREVYRVLKTNSFLYAIVSSDDFFMYQKELPKMGFKVQGYPLIWHKTGTITRGRRPWEYARDFEPILLAVKGNPILTSGTEFSSIFTHAAINPSKLTHPNEKPIELINTIIRQCSYVGSTILDPFAGSGVVLEAAKKLDRKYIGVEREKRFFDKIEGRLK